MASQSTYLESLRAALDAASVDLSRHPDERVAFDRVTLARVVSLYKESGGVDKTKAGYRQLWKTLQGKRLTTDEWATEALALMKLRERLTGSADRRYEETADGPRLRNDIQRAEYDAILEDLSWTEEPGEF